MNRKGIIYSYDTEGPVMISEEHYDNIVNSGHVINSYQYHYHKRFDVFTEGNADSGFGVTETIPFDDYALNIFENSQFRTVYYFERYVLPSEGYYLYTVMVEPNISYVNFSEPKYIPKEDSYRPQDESF